MAWMKKRSRLAELNPVILTAGVQYDGRGPKRISQLHEDILRSYHPDHWTVAFTIVDLDRCSVDARCDSERTLETLKEVYYRLTNFEARRNRDENGDDHQTRYAKIFIAYGGVEKYGEELACQIAEHDDVLDYVFTLLQHDKTCLTACQFLEDLLQARKQVLNLNNISNLKRLVAAFDDKKLANFCRVLAVTISDLDIYENKSSLFAQHKQKSSKGFVNVRDVNQELLLSVPDLIPRLVGIAVSKEYTPRYGGMSSELDCWMEWIENFMQEDALDIHLEDDLENFIGGISEPASFGSSLVQQAGLRISNVLILRVQVIYVLGLFLVGKHRKKVQRKLADLKLIAGLSELFDQFIWKCQAHRNNRRHRLRGHNASCECSPEVALKIQFLRLVHSFCDHSDYKHLLLTKSELNEVKKINAMAGPLETDGLDRVNKNLMCQGSKGLLTKIVEVMKKEPTASTFRFWLARAVESYLRGSTSFCDQVFLLKKGLLQHIASNIVDHDVRPKEILQSSFDLLGELVKFNIEAFREFAKVLNTQARMEKFITSINKNLVDSNMFIRALILSLDHLTVTQPQYKDYALSENCLLMHVSKFETQLDYLRKLINLINVQNLTQENVSCLNTTLVFLMFASQKNQLAHYLRALTMETTQTGICTSNLTIMRNFHDLLVFWQDHYLHKDKDCSALEKSSRISFDYWKQTVATMVSEDRNLPTSVCYYLEPDTFRDS
ncbi:hypothetical protein LSH36_438g02046 [Paralvinella palmiformis]|uniref:Short transient receptor potential channel 4-associated protein n=1 Tax=Paralvinella palmiformis TaxID=53620 RepID=A0AAD9JCH4_9ANNE|nr:hypothetical protein LSH36_438g02046 [Paralvinella palmiformis]